MGWLTSALKGVKAVAKPLSAIGNIPVVGSVVKAVPFVGAGLAAAGAVSSLLPGGGGGGGGQVAGGLPALPGMGSMGIPPVAGQGFPGMAGMGDRSIFRNDPNVSAQIAPWAIPARGLRQSFRAPKGFVVLRDEKGDPFGLPKFIARKMGWWKPAKKPPISAGEWAALGKANKVVRTLKKANRQAMKVANFRVGPRPQPKTMIPVTHKVTKIAKV